MVLVIWMPRGVDPASREVLAEGVPQYLKPALLEWLRLRTASFNRASASWRLNVDFFRAYDVVARPVLSYSTRAKRDWPGFIEDLPDEELLDLVDWVVHSGSEDERASLSVLLTNASSAWMVGTRNGNFGLVRRVSEAVQAAAAEASGRGVAGALLAEAWAACFGRSSDPEEAYEKAIKAVEEAAASVVSPKNLKTTLGSMIRDMRAQGDWKLDLPGNAQDVPVSMMEALWTGQESRHGGNGYRVPTQSEAEAAVLLAVSLVHWFTSGTVARRP